MFETLGDETLGDDFLVFTPEPQLCFACLKLLSMERRHCNRNGLTISKAKMVNIPSGKHTKNY